MEKLNEVQRRQEHLAKMKVFVMWTLMVLVSGVLIAAPGWAGGKGKHYGHDPEKKLQKLTKRLGLSEEQQGKVKSILEEKHHKLQELHKQMKEVRKNARAQIEAQLTPEQVQKFKKHRDKRKHGKKGGMGKHGKKHKKKHSGHDDEDGDDEDDDENDDD